MDEKERARLRQELEKDQQRFLESLPEDKRRKLERQLEADIPPFLRDKKHFRQAVKRFRDTLDQDIAQFFDDREKRIRKAIKARRSQS